MALPTFRSLAARRQQQREKTDPDTEGRDGVIDNSHASAERASPGVTGVDLKKATKTRRHAILISCIFFLISLIFLILTEIGNINTKPVIRSSYFLKIDMSDIIPASTPSGLTFTNSLARSLGLHDFYTVGLWTFCEGYNNEGVTGCSSPVALYWFNPVSILLNELLFGATIALPAEINDILALIKIASHLMFGFFLVGTLMTVISIAGAPLVLYSRWVSFPFAIWTFLQALFVMAAAVIATVMFVIFKTIITSQTELDIGAALGLPMFVFMWIGAGFAVAGCVIHLGLGCCGVSRRDVKSGRKVRKWRALIVAVDGKPRFGGRKKSEGEVV
ncbi:hypothetical protein B7494_g257 [Chlorociboria aeruginascens]|nr:hypothetical protein B7494_g257 [Chlorociboria aeruginascens]